MRHLAFLPLALLAATPAAALQPLMPPHIVAETFCMARIVGDMSFIEGYLTDELSYAIDKAIATNAVIQKEKPDEKPPLGDGVPWASYPDAVPSCVVDYEAAKTSPEAIPVIYEIPGAPDAGWTDTLILRQVKMDWQLDDVRYENGGKLSESLNTQIWFNEDSARLRALLEEYYRPALPAPTLPR